MADLGDDAAGLLGGMDAEGAEEAVDAHNAGAAVLQAQQRPFLGSTEYSMNDVANDLRELDDP
jgi:hypothetical protein